MRLLDLFCGAGMASDGYRAAAVNRFVHHLRSRFALREEGSEEVVDRGYF